MIKRDLSQWGRDRKSGKYVDINYVDLYTLVPQD